MATIVDCQRALQIAASNALNAAGILVPNQVVRGWPEFNSLSKIIAAEQFITSIFPMPTAKNITRFMPQWGQLGPPIVKSLFVNLANNVLTFTGTVTGGIYNVHAVVGYPQSAQDAWYQTILADTPTTIATAVAGAINTLNTGASAIPATNAVTVTGLPVLSCHVGTFGVLAQEVRRQEQNLRVTVWAPTSDLRDQAGAAIENAIGLAGSYWYPLADGTQVFVHFIESAPSDEHIKALSIFRYDLTFCCEFVTIQTETATQIEDWNFKAKLLQPPSTIFDDIDFG